MAALIDAGELKFTYKDYVLDSHRPHAQWAAEAAHCAADQNQFWAYRATLFMNQKKWSEAELKLYAKELKLDTKQFNQCFDSGTHREAVNQSTKEAIDLKLPGTPSYRINGTEIDLNKANTVQSFMDLVKSEMAKVK